MRVVPVDAARGRKDRWNSGLSPAWAIRSRLVSCPAIRGGELAIPSDLHGRIGDGPVPAVTPEPFGGPPTSHAMGPTITSGTTRRSYSSLAACLGHNRLAAQSRLIPKSAANQKTSLAAIAAGIADRLLIFGIGDRPFLSGRSAASFRAALANDA